jgi:outer membrane biosynthesis protein TonB
MAVVRNTEQHDERHRRIWRVALIASLLLHILVFLLFRSDIVIPPSPVSAAGPRAGDARAAAGGGTRVVTLQVIETPQEPVVEIETPVPVPIPEPDLEPVVEEPPKPQVVAAVTAALDGKSVGEGKGDAKGEGIEGATGRGDGGTGEEGNFRDVIPPSPRGLILPPSDRPGKVRGKEVDVWVFVSAVGRVVEDSTRVAPPTGDRRFDDRLRKQASEWVFEPARRAGSPVAEWFRYTIIL